MKQLVNVNLTARTCDWAPPVLTFGESLTLAFAFTKSTNGNLVAPNLAFSGCQAAIGQVDARPLGGDWALQIGTGASTSANTTEVLNYNATAAQLSAAVNALPAVVAAYGACVARFVQGSWLLLFGNRATAVPLSVVNNSLWPISFGSVMGYQVNAQWMQTVRLVQSPVSFASDFDIVLPDPPVVTPVQSGLTSGSQLKPTIEQLYVPPDFQGAYTLNFNTYQQTALLNPTAGPSDIQSALQAAVDPGITVALPQNYTFLITFGGDLNGSPQPLLTVSVQSAPPGNLTITLPLDTAELATYLRLAGAQAPGASVTLPLQLQIAAAEDGGATQQICALVLPVTLQPSLVMPSMETTPAINWVVPPSPASYTPFGADNVLTTGQTYCLTIGAVGTASYTLTHGLATDDVRAFVRQNIDPGYQLIEGSDYLVQIQNSNQVKIIAVGAVTVTSASTGSTAVTISGAPPLSFGVGVGLLGSTVAAIAGTAVTLAGNANANIAAATSAPFTPVNNSWRMQVFSAHVVAQWAAGLTVTTGQVTGLAAFEAATNSNLATLNTLLPSSASLPSGSGASTALTIPIAPANGWLFAPKTVTAASALPGDAPFLLPSINSTTNLGALPTTPLPAPGAGNLYTVAADVLVPGGGRIRDSWAKAGGFVGSDGRILAPYTRAGTRDSYYPTPFELTLFEAYIDDMMFVGGQTLTLWFGLQLQMLLANTEAQWAIAIEQAPIQKAVDVGSSPANWTGKPGSPPSGGNTFGINLAGVNWDLATRLVYYPMVITSLAQQSWFGVQIANSGGGAFTANGFYYNRIIAANAAAPTTTDFALRARLIDFDARLKKYAEGWVGWGVQAPPTGTLGLVIQ